MYAKVPHEKCIQIPLDWKRLYPDIQMKFSSRNSLGLQLVCRQ